VLGEGGGDSYVGDEGGRTLVYSPGKNARASLKPYKALRRAGGME
jgi:hypothetical protein